MTDTVTLRWDEDDKVWCASGMGRNVYRRDKQRALAEFFREVADVMAQACIGYVATNIEISVRVM